MTFQKKKIQGLAVVPMRIFKNKIFSRTLNVAKVGNRDSPRFPRGFLRIIYQRRFSKYTIFKNMRIFFKGLLLCFLSLELPCTLRNIFFEGQEEPFYLVRVCQRHEFLRIKLSMTNLGVFCQLMFILFFPPKTI